jgi:hypothetical protein
METGYYDCVTLPNCVAVASSHTPAHFPTEFSNSGPYTVDVSQFWIGPLRFPMSAFLPGDVPSIEEGAQDPADPDGVPNLDPRIADCDDESAEHDPAGNNCRPVPAWSIPPNAMVIMLVVSMNANPSWFLTWPYNNTGGVTEVFWNVLIDLDKGGSWGAGEWVVTNSMEILPPGRSLLISDTFLWPTTGQGFFRPISLPNWIRNTLTSEPVAGGGSSWAGEGPSGGFAAGEIEDYFFEWMPKGQQFSPPQEMVPPTADQLVAIACPEEVSPGGMIECEVSGPPSDETMVACFGPDTKVATGGGPQPITKVQAPQPVCTAEGFELQVTTSTGSIIVEVGAAPSGSRILMYREASDTALRRGANGVPIAGGAVVTVTE